MGWGGAGAGNLDGTDGEHIVAEGLSSASVAQRLREVGPNVLPSAALVPAWRQLLAQFMHFFALMLWVAGALAILGGMFALGVAIFVVIVVNGLFAFAQEYRAERAAERLRDLLPRLVTVVRDGALMSIDAVDVVPDDLVVLGEGIT
ncbi:MAG: cation-transporting P-type ATPase [Microthrixaceae bacterium]|nr:cation-transporting P-type ATPase [Microthrixaceae bacterium]